MVGLIYISWFREYFFVIKCFGWVAKYTHSLWHWEEIMQPRKSSVQLIIWLNLGKGVGMLGTLFTTSALESIWTWRDTGLLAHTWLHTHMLAHTCLHIHACTHTLAHSCLHTHAYTHTLPVISSYAITLRVTCWFPWGVVFLRVLSQQAIKLPADYKVIILFLGISVKPPSHSKNVSSF